jgi:hypothetical protein
MTDPVDPTVGGGYDGGGTEGGGATGYNPAWAEALDGIPQEYHEKLASVYKKWDSNVDKRFEQVHSKYGQWDPIINTVGDPQQVQWAVNMLNALEQNPREVYDRIGEYFRFNGQPTPGTDEQGRQNQQQQEDDPYKDRFATLERQNQLLTDYLSQQREQQMQAEADRWLDSELTSAKKKHGDFDEDYVVALMQHRGLSADDAVAHFKSMQTKWGAPAPAPLIMGPGGGIPNMNKDVRHMKDREVSSLVAQMLDQTFKQAQ